MPIITPDSDPELHVRLEAAGAAVLTQQEAETQDIRPARIGILNLMPATAMEATEAQWLRNISRTVLQIEPVLLRFDQDPRADTGTSRSEILKRYIPISKAKERGLDGLIITGDNLELVDSRTRNPTLLPFEEVLYAEQLKQVVEWADHSVRSTIYSCWASHFALKHLYGVEREPLTSKFFGVYEHDVDHSSGNPVIAGMNDTFTAPHSRWGNVPAAQVEQDTDLELLAVSEQVGWLLLSGTSASGNRRLLCQGHPEYDVNDLAREHIRDRALRPTPPKNYYHPETGEPRLTWATDRNTLHANIINELYSEIS